MTRAVDPCRIAGPELLRPVVAAAIGAYFPLTFGQDGTSVRLTDPSLHELTCPRLTVSLRAAVRARMAGQLGSVTRAGVVRFRSPLEARISYRGTKGTFGPPPPPETAEDVLEAQLCLSNIEVTGLDLAGVPNWLDGTLIRACLNGDLAGWTGCRDVARETCSNITPLVQAYVASGGTF